MVSEREHMRISEASKELGVARSTAHRLMQMLHYYGLVTQDSDSKFYSAGPALVTLGLQVVRDLDVRTVAQPHIEALVEEVRETVHLMALQASGDLTCLDSVESPQNLRIGSRTGFVLPTFATAGGRSILAFRSEEEIRKMYPGARLPKLGPATVGTRADLLAELELTRKRGYALQHEELDAGVSAVAAAITDGRNNTNFSVCVAMPSSRLADTDIPRIAAAAMACAANISMALSYPRTLAEERPPLNAADRGNVSAVRI
jgi:DNA-binding IclR family transcriptional regulator